MNKKVYITASAAVFVLIIVLAVVLAINGKSQNTDTPKIDNESSIDVRISVKPDTSKAVDIKDSKAFCFDLGVVTSIDNIIWYSDETAAVISEKDGHIWVFECDFAKNTTTEKSIIKLESGEKYSSSKKLSDGKLCIVTNKNIRILNEKLAEDRCVMIRTGSGEVSEAAVNDDGSQFLFIDENGLNIAGTGSTHSKLLIATNLNGDSSKPYKAGFINDNYIYYHYISSDRTITCHVTDINKSFNVSCKNVNQLSSVTAGFISVFDSELFGGIRTVKITDNTETLYRLDDFTVYSLAGEENGLYIAGTTTDGKLAIEKIDLISTASSTVLVLNDKIQGLGNSLFISDYGKCAVQVDKYDNGNASLLIFDKI